MVVTYLEKIRAKFLEEKINVDAKLTELYIVYKENVAFIKVLEKNNDEHFEAFTPRTVNSFHKRKIEELKEEQKKLESQIEKLKSELENINKELEEVANVIKFAKEKYI